MLQHVLKQKQKHNAEKTVMNGKSFHIDIQGNTAKTNNGSKNL